MTVWNYVSFVSLQRQILDRKLNIHFFKSFTYGVQRYQTVVLIGSNFGIPKIIHKTTDFSETTDNLNAVKHCEVRNKIFTSRRSWLFTEWKWDIYIWNNVKYYRNIIWSKYTCSWDLSNILMLRVVCASSFMDWSRKLILSINAMKVGRSNVNWRAFVFLVESASDILSLFSSSILIMSLLYSSKL